VRWQLKVLDKQWLYKTDACNAWVEEAKYALFEPSVVDAVETQTVMIEQTGAEVTERKKSMAIKSVGADLKLFDSFGKQEQEEVEVVTQSEGVFGGIHFYCVGFTADCVSDWWYLIER
jgi:hypothetical protein